MWKQFKKKKHGYIKYSRDFALPSPSSLMDFGWETAKHCIVSYFWGASWLSWPSSSESGKGFTSIRQLNVWLFRLGGSPDQEPPFTKQGKVIQNYKETNIRLITNTLSKWNRKHTLILFLYTEPTTGGEKIFGLMFQQLGKMLGIFKMSFYSSLWPPSLQVHY